jgi:hypothetical protein
MEQLSFDDLEAWCPVPDWPYEASDHGQIRSLHRKVPHILRPSWYTGYGVVILYRNGEREGRTVHSLVMEAFAGPCPPGKEIRHLDGNPANNRWAPGSTEEEVRAAGGNLIYGTAGENIFDQVRHGTHPEASRDCCDKGHEYTEENTYIATWPDGSFKQRACRACHNEATKQRRLERLKNAPPCSRDDCDDPQMAKKLCSRHYQQQWSEQKKSRDVA